MNTRQTENPPNSYFIIALNTADIVSVSALIFALCGLAMACLQKFDFSLAFLLIAMALDFLDGPIARRLGVGRDFGRYLDSFVDVIIYLVGPATLLFMSGFNTAFYAVTLMTFVTCGVLRLSVFNEIGNLKSETGQLSYLGMPVLWSVLYISIYRILSWFEFPLNLDAVLAGAIIIHSFFMLVRRPFFKIKANAISIACFFGLAATFIVHGVR